MSKSLPEGVETSVEKTGRSHKHRFEKGPDTAPRSRDEHERRERDAWNYTKEQLKRHEGLSEAKADAAVRRAREREHARKRERGERY